VLKGLALHLCHSPASREMSFRSVAHSDKFSKTDFKKTGFAAAGAERQQGENTERSCGCLPARAPAAGTGSRFCRGLWDTKERFFPQGKQGAAGKAPVC
jgi:hypothetical protein